MADKEQTLTELMEKAIPESHYVDNEDMECALNALCKACGLSLEVLEQIRSGEAIVIPTGRIWTISYLEDSGCHTFSPDTVQLNTPIPEENK